MKSFMDENFLLESDIARELYHNCAAGLPIIDYHCHIDANEIAEDRRFDNIAQVWLGGDHYKWRAMRICGIPEKYITGDASDYEKWCAFCGAMPMMIGSPLYHWAHLELKKYFGIDLAISKETAAEIWNRCNASLRHMTARQMIARSNVEVICTTNDPTETLAAHEKIAADPTFATRVFPAFRPDPAVSIDKPAFLEYIPRLGQAAGVEINSFATLAEALERRIDFFAAHGCRAADHGLDSVPFGLKEENELDEILQKALSGAQPTVEEAEAFKTAVIARCAAKYASLGWVMEVHFGVLRNTNARMFAMLGADSGFDTAGQQPDAQKLACLLDHLNSTDALPKTVLFPIDPAKNIICQTLAGSFQAEGVRGRVQQGAAWWFNDTKSGMEAQLKSFSELSVLGCFIGMLTDSRSFLSYTRHEYFRRIICNFVGGLVENGEYPNDLPALRMIISDICYGNAKTFFGWDDE